MRTLQQAYPFLKGSDIYLGETSCTGRELGSVLVFSHGLQECQTTETVSIEDRNVSVNNILFKNMCKVHRDIQHNHIYNI